jgi:hypothetical protein
MELIASAVWRTPTPDNTENTSSRLVSKQSDRMILEQDDEASSPDRPLLSPLLVADTKHANPDRRCNTPHPQLVFSSLTAGSPPLLPRCCMMASSSSPSSMFRSAGVCSALNHFPSNNSLMLSISASTLSHYTRHTFITRSNMVVCLTLNTTS